MGATVNQSANWRKENFQTKRIVNVLLDQTVEKDEMIKTRILVGSIYGGQGVKLVK